MSTELNFLCGCGKQITLDLTDEEDVHNQRALGFLVGEKGWVLCEPSVDNKGRTCFMATCSAECHNRRFMEATAAEPRSRHRWWTKCHKFAGEPPPCTCKVGTREDGLLIDVREKSCLWHIWMDGWRLAHNDIVRKLFEQWQLVKPGTLVKHYDRYAAPSAAIRYGRVSGPAKLFEYSFGGFLSAVIPVEDWRPFPHLEDLLLVAEDSAK